MLYKLQLQHPLWYDKREEIKLRDGNKCILCNSRYKLTVHHTYYKLGLLAWEYPNDCYQTLCAKCHQEIHLTTKIPKERKKRQIKVKVEITEAQIEAVLNEYKRLIDEFIVKYPHIHAFSNYLFKLNSKLKDSEKVIAINYNNEILYPILFSLGNKTYKTIMDKLYG